MYILFNKLIVTGYYSWFI